MGTRENIVTIGMRGDGDMPMTRGRATSRCSSGSSPTSARSSPTSRRRTASQTPQLWALYKEVQDYYDKGMRVPDDVTLLFSDDNWGNIRRLPERGGSRPRRAASASTTTSTTSAARATTSGSTRIRSRASGSRCTSRTSTGANRIWIVNVGDLKPMEFPISVLPRLRVESGRDSRRAAARVHARSGPRSSSAPSTRAGDRRHHDDVLSSTPAAESRSCSTPATYSLDELSRSRARRRGLRLAAARAPKRSERAAGRVRATRTTSWCCIRCRRRRI